MHDVAFVMSPRDPLGDLVTALRAELGRQGMTCSVQESFSEADPGRLYVLVAPGRYVRTGGVTALPSPALLSRTVFLCSGPTEEVVADRDLLARGGCVFHTSQSAVSALHRAGVAARLLRPGYCPEWDRFDPDAARDIDILFLGGRSPRRTRALSRSVEVLARHPCVIRIADPGEIALSERQALLCRTKALMSVHGGEDRQVDWLHMLEAMHCGAVFVGEHSTGFAPLEPGRDLLLAAPDALAWVADAVLGDVERLAGIRERAYARLRDWLPFSVSVAVLRAALVEMLGRPLDAPGAVTEVRRSDAEDSEKKAGQPSLAAALAETQRELAGVRRQLGRIEMTVMDPAGGAEDASGGSEDTSSTWASRSNPRVSVLLALDSSPERTHRTLTAVATTATAGEEIIITTHGESGSAQVARQWVQSQARFPAALVSFDGRPTRGGLLNATLERAGAPLCLLLSPGQVVLPRCLTALAGLLEDDPALDLVYGIEAIRGDSQTLLADGGDHLVGFAEWDPRALREGDRIGAPLLVRTQTLRDMGGFAAVAAIAGYERYDLLCRLAERGSAGRLVPEILCWRPAFEAEQELGFARPQTTLAAGILAERSPELLAGAFGAG